MSSDYFLLTYSVKAQTGYESDIKKAEKVRNDIAKITEWDKSENNETTFMGVISANGVTEESRKNFAKKEVESKFLEILKEHDASKYDVIIYCSMMIESAARYFEFEISQ
ncbi:hypothetical protein [Proteus faecis]|uniref:hypothetical protein n=1 Tax=Proteus faecis TaxID=2050967 RepID=UPI003075B61E